MFCYSGPIGGKALFSMAALSDYVVPLLLLTVSCYSLHKRCDSYGRLVQGAAEGLRVLLSIAPSLIILLTAVQMLQAANVAQWMAHYLAPIVSFLGIPVETVPLLLIRPVSGSAALAVGAELIARYGADSTVGLTAAVMLGSTETTFYTICVYFGAAGVRKTRYAIPAALIADFVGFLVASTSVRWLF